MAKAKGEYEVYSNTNHFGKITHAQMSRWKFDYWAGGNTEVIKHLESIGVKCFYIERSGDITAGDLRMLKRIKESL